MIAPLGGGASEILEDQAVINKNLKWVQGLSVGIDAYLTSKKIKEDPKIPLTNIKGAYSSVLAEYIALGVLFHAKHVGRFMERKAQHKWETEPVEVVSGKHMLIVGYGDIGAACAKVAKTAFGMKVTGLKRRPDTISQEHKSYCSAIIGND